MTHSAIPTVSVAAIIFDQRHRVLLIQRQKAPSAGLWSIPGGRQESGENLSEACKREVQEETGMIVVPLQIVAVAERIVAPFHYVIVDFLARCISDETTLRASSDALDAIWVSLDDLEKLDLAEGVEPVVRAAYRIHAEQCKGLTATSDKTSQAKTLDYIA